MLEIIVSSFLSGLEAVRLPYCLTVLAEATGCEVNMETKNRQPSVTAHPYPKDLEGMEMPENLLDKGRIPAVLAAIKIIRESRTRRTYYRWIGRPSDPCLGSGERKDLYEMIY